MVKVRVVRMTPGARKALMTHVRYVERDGAGEDGRQGQFFDRHGENADGQAFADRCVDDRHHFRIIVNPEDGRDLPDLKDYARSFMGRVEHDMGASLDWVAGAHFDTGRPHLHILVRGRLADGRDLVIPRDYVSHGLRDRAQGLATELLGPRLEVTSPSSREITGDHYTRLDRCIIEGTRSGRFILSDTAAGQHGDVHRRLVHLETRGWAKKTGVQEWEVSPNLERTLREAGERDLRQGAAAKAVWRSAWRDQIDRLERLDLKAGERHVGVYVGVEPAGPYRSGPQAVVLETLDGRLCHARLPSVQAALILDHVPAGAIVSVAGHARMQRPSDQTVAEIAAETGGVYSAQDHRRTRPADSAAFIERHLRRVEALRREGVCRQLTPGRFSIPDDYVAQGSLADAGRHGAAEIEVRVLDVRRLDQQPEARGITWLDRVREGRETLPATGGLAHEARRLGQERLEVLQGWGVSPAEGGAFGEDERLALWRMEIDAQASRWAPDSKPFVMATKEGQTFSGLYMGRAHMGGRTYAVFENTGAVTLAPWKPALEAGRGQVLTGTLQGGQVDFSFGQLQRALGLSL